MKTVATFPLLALTAMTLGQGFDSQLYKDLSWTNVGPNRGGRSIACTGVRNRPNVYFFGATGGGLWKTVDSGTSWTCVTDGYLTTSSVGAVSVSESNPDIIYIGTGEREIRGNISQGDGVYKSIDGGKTWKHIGLESTKTIAKIVIDPKNPDVVYVAALGDTYHASSDRGIYKSTDGGVSWTKVLFESPKAGAVDLAIDPTNSRILYAATWEAWRTPWHLNSGGPGSKLWKSLDGGSNWVEISRNKGLPAGVLGKIGIGIAPSSPNRIYAIVEASDGGIFSSEDAGQTWIKLNDEAEYRQRAWYFSHLIVDPKDANKLYCLNVGAFKSSDGGTKWSGFAISHSDNHDLWINPDDPTKMIESNDGGATVSIDGGRTWSKLNFPTAQLYHVSVDNHVPYRIYGAQQDNSAVRVMPDIQDRPDRRNFDNTAGGESGYITPSPADPDIVYGGNYSGDIAELNYRTMTRRRVDAWPDNPMGHGANEIKHRIQWTFPIVFSPHDPKTMYTTSQYLLRTRNDGQTWDTISPDLTRNDKTKQVSSGGPITQDNTSVEYYDTVFTVAESPKRAGVIWAGSDDGLIHVTMNGGRTWTDVTPPNMPHWGRVSMIEASHFDAGTAYAAVNDYQNGDTHPYLYRTKDFGKSWTKITVGIEANAFTRVCREDLYRPGLLYAGTETGVYVSFDDGDHWKSLQLNLPLCPVHDLALKNDDLIAATHGRSFWIMHHVSRLSELTSGQPEKPILYHPIPRMRTTSARATVEYYLPKVAKKVSVSFFDRRGVKLGETTGGTDVGIHEASTSLTHAAFISVPNMVLWAGYPSPIPAPPGTYIAKLDVDGHTVETPFELTKDPRIEATTRDLEEQFDFSVEISDRITVAHRAVLRIRHIKRQISDALKDKKTDAELIAAGTQLTEKLTSIEGEIHQYRSVSGEDPLNFPIMLNDRMAGVLSFVQERNGAPTRESRTIFKELSKLLSIQLDNLKRAESSQLKALNEMLKAKGHVQIVPKKNSTGELAPVPRKTEEEDSPSFG